MGIMCQYSKICLQRVARVKLDRKQTSEYEFPKEKMGTIPFPTVITVLSSEHIKNYWRQFNRLIHFAVYLTLIQHCKLTVRHFQKRQCVLSSTTRLCLFLCIRLRFTLCGRDALPTTPFIVPCRNECLFIGRLVKGD